MSQATRTALRTMFQSPDLSTCLDEIARFTACDDSEIEDLTDYATECE